MSAAEAGYAHPLYAASLAEFGRPRRLEASGGWLLERSIPGTDARDAIGCYPLFTVERWDRLADDLQSLAGDLVSATVVCDPFGAHTPELLHHAFDVVRPFKVHFVTDLRSPGFTASPHHRYYARRALRRIAIEKVSTPLAFLDEWCTLYDVIVRRYHLTGLRAFSRAAFATQLAVPGMSAFRAAVGGETVAGQLWYVDRRVAYSHLTAANPLGSTLRASYALWQVALEHLAGEADWADLGGGAGLDPAPSDGLVAFKRGWATGTRLVYLCGRTLDPERYRTLSGLPGTADGVYFPAYRAGTPE